jgi:cytochrome c553
MKTRILVAIALTLAIGGSILAVRSNLQTTVAQTAPRDIPETIILGEKVPIGKITFNHATHASKNMNPDGTTPITCVTCHHVEQPAGDIANDPVLKTVYPADRTVKLTAETYKDPATPQVTKCLDCHAQKGTTPKLLPEIPSIKDDKGQAISMTNQNAMHRNCASCHDQVVKAKPEIKAPKTMACVQCHKKA